MPLRRIVVLASGRGTNLQALLDAGPDRLGGEIVTVISQRRTAPALVRAESHGIGTRVVPLRAYPTRAAWDEALAEALEESAPDLIVCAGFGLILGRAVLERYPTRIVNVHPALLPAFAGGLHAQADALAYGVKVTGCTVHFVTEDLDAGPIITQRALAVREDDTVESLTERLLMEEHAALVDAVGLFCRDRLAVSGRRVVVRVEGESSPCVR